MKTPGEVKTKRKNQKRESGIGERLSYIRGLAHAAKKVAAEEQLMLKFDARGKRVN